MSKIPLEYRDKVTVYKDESRDVSEQGQSVILRGASRESEDLQNRKTEQESQGERIAQEEYRKSLEMKVTIRGNQVLVPATLDYGGKEIEALLLLDTGAELLTLHRETADQLNIKQSKKVAVQVTGGKVIKARLVKLTHVIVGPHKKTNVHALIIGHKGPSVKHDGLLGMNFLRDLEFSIDFKNQVIKWKP